MGFALYTMQASFVKIDGLDVDFPIRKWDPYCLV